MSDIPRTTLLSDAAMQDQQRVQHVHMMPGQAHLHSSTAGEGAGHTIPTHHDPHVPLESDPARQGQHDGTTYALGATGEPYEQAAVSHKAGLGERIKEALPGTKEHKAKKAEEGNLAVYS